jgi:limonene-1,2-epoxide hydrolase
MDKLAVMNAFFEAINANDKARILSFFNEDSVFDNVPLGPVTGLEAIWQTFASVHERATAVNWEIHNMELGPSGTVYTERSDRYLLDGQWAEFRCAGIHEINDDGTFTLWRDYFDLQQSLATMPQ